MSIDATRPILIGGVMPLSRPGFLEAGRHIKAGLELGVADLNAHGGLHDRPLHLILRDTGAGVASAGDIVDDLDRAGAVAIVGEYHSVVARALAVRATALGLPFVCSSAVLDALTDKPTEWVARIAPAQSRCWQVYADHLIAAGHRRVALIMKPDRYWSTGAEALEARFGEQGGEVVRVDASTMDAAAIAERLAAEIEVTAALTLVGYPEPVVSIIKAIRVHPALVGLTIGDPAGRAEFSGWSDLLGEDGFGIPFLRYRASDLSEIGRNVEKRLARVLGEAPSFVALEAHDAISVLSAALQVAGPDRRRLSASFNQIAVAGTRGEIRFSRVPGVSVWQWAWPPIEVAMRDHAAPHEATIKSHPQP